jgi:hypothetical protein
LFKEDEGQTEKPVATHMHASSLCRLIIASDLVFSEKQETTEQQQLNNIIPSFTRTFI